MGHLVQISGGRGHRRPTSIGIKISTVCSFVSLQSDGRMDGGADRITIPKAMLA